jgi:PilZ domain
MKKQKVCDSNGGEFTKPYLTGTPPIAMLTGNFRQVFETLKPCFWSGSMAETQQDQQNQDQDNNKRATRRFSLRLPVSVRYGENEQEHEAQTRDVSARGICFYVDSAIQAGSAIDFTLTLPPEITLTESIRVRCKGRVVRVEGGSPSQKMTVAAVIDEYDFLADV